jgi:transposase-like protein
MMKTDSSGKAAAAELQEQIERARSAGGLEQLSTSQLLGLLLDSLFRAERAAYLERAEDDKGNGSYERAVNVGSLPVEVEVPRTREGDFRPSNLPSPYQRGYGDAARGLLLRLAASSRSQNATKEALRGLGLPASEPQLDAVAKHFITEFELRNTRPLDTDLIALFLDAKYVEVRDADRLRPYGVYVAIGLGRDGLKRVLTAQIFPGRESLESWKTLLRSLLERGLRNVMIVVHDDFSGLLNVTKGLFPTADVQLCIVHMQRNAKIHLGKTQATEFNNRMRTIKGAWSPELAATQFDDLCQQFAKDAPTFIAELTKKREHYLAFLRYPESLRRTFSTTNVVEAVNGQLEILRRNNGGYFHGEDNLKAKLGIHLDRLENGRWRRVAAVVFAVLSQLNAMFVTRFEGQG